MAKLHFLYPIDRSNSRYPIPRWLKAIFAVALVVGLSIPTPYAFSQAGVGDWMEPVNLSGSGGTTNPQLLATSENELLVAWDEGDSNNIVSASSVGFVTFSEAGWSDPIWIEPPFSGRPTRLLTTQVGVIHAFWIDNQGWLLYRRVMANEFGRTGWGGARRLAADTVYFDVIADSENRIHVGYLTALDNNTSPAGVHYLRSLNAGQTWSTPNVLYRSDYYRRFAIFASGGPPTLLTEQETAHVDIEIAETQDGTTVYVAWDNPSLRRVYSTFSDDAGVSWESPIEVDGPDRDEPYASPRKIEVHANGERIQRLWQIYYSGGSCTQVYQASTDGGQTWSDTSSFQSQFNDCPETIQSFDLENGALIYFLVLQHQAYLLAWQEGQWSLPQPQQDIDFFTDPETYNFVELGCRQAGLIEDRLMVVGCDLAEGGDTWFREVKLGDTVGWFEQETGWEQSGRMTYSPAQMHSLQSVSDARGATHFLWSESNSSPSAPPTTAIQYVRWDQGVGRGPFQIWEELMGLTAQIELVSASEQRLLAMWSGGRTGEIYYSWANFEEASTPAGWISPKIVQPQNAYGQFPDIVVNPSGIIYMAYVIPVNEGRGIYLTRSEDSGQTWLEAARVYDAAAAGCAMVDRPSFTYSDVNRLHLAWSCSTLPGGIGPLAMYHILSEDGGESWSPPMQVTDKPAVWNEIIDDGVNALHFFWSDQEAGSAHIWHTISRNDGQTWESPRIVSSRVGTAHWISLERDRSGQLHLLEAIQSEDAPPIVFYDLWAGESWSNRESLILDAAHMDDVGELTSSIDSEDDLFVVYSRRGGEDVDGVREYEIVFNVIPIVLGSAAVDEARQRVTVESVPLEVAEPPEASALSIEDISQSDVVDAAESSPSGPSAGLIVGITIGSLTSLGIVAAMFRRRLRPPV